jgi:hypothetical protein
MGIEDWKVTIAITVDRTSEARIIASQGIWVSAETQTSIIYMLTMHFSVPVLSTLCYDVR